MLKSSASTVASKKYGVLDESLCYIMPSDIHLVSPQMSITTNNKSSSVATIAVQ